MKYLNQVTAALFVAVTLLMSLASCGGSSAAEADKAAAAYYAEKFNANDHDRQLYGDIDHWDAMDESRKTSVEGKIMTMIIGFYHKNDPEKPHGHYFVMQNTGKGWTVRSMGNGIYIPKEMREDLIRELGPIKPQPKFGPQEQAALNSWKEEFAGHRDTHGREETDPEKIASVANGYFKKYGDYIDCFVEKGSDNWSSENSGNVYLKIYHEKESTERNIFVERSDDGSWKVK